MKDNSHRLQLKKFKLDMEQNFFSKRVVLYLKQTTGVVGDLCSGEVSKTLKVLGEQRQPAVLLATVVLCRRLDRGLQRFLPICVPIILGNLAFLGLT